MTTETQKDEQIKPVTATVIPPKKKKKGRALKILLILAVLVGGALYGLYSCGASAIQSAIFYKAEVVGVHDLEVKVSDSGAVEPADSYNVTALVTGEVLDASFEEGQIVQKDDLLYTIDPGTRDNSVQSAILSVEQAQLQYNSVYENLNPHATRVGVVQQLFVRAGDIVSPGTPLAEIADSDTMTIELPFHSGDAAKLWMGQDAVLTLEGNLETLTGAVTAISGAEYVGLGGTLLRDVEITVENPGALTSENTATAVVDGIACAGTGVFENLVSQTVVAGFSGEISNIYVAEGDRVDNGTSLCTIGGAAAHSSLSGASMGLQNAQLSLENAQEALEAYQIEAPISGTVIEKMLKTGDNVEATTGPLAILYDMSYLTFKLNIDELDISKLKVGQTVRVTSDALPDEELSGVVDKISINGTTMNGVTTYPVTIMMTDAGTLLPGMNVSADILVEQVKGVMAIPLDAVQRGNIVQVLPADYVDGTEITHDMLESVTVELGRNDQEHIEILSGLTEGQKIVSVSMASTLMEQMMGGMSGPPGAAAMYG